MVRVILKLVLGSRELKMSFDNCYEAFKTASVIFDAAVTEEEQLFSMEVKPEYV